MVVFAGRLLRQSYTPYLFRRRDGQAGDPLCVCVVHRGAPRCSTLRTKRAMKNAHAAHSLDINMPRHAATCIFPGVDGAA